MRWLDVVVLSLVQGVTEIFPVSSDGHLTVLQRILNVPADIRLNLTATLHLGTALAILLFFRNKVKELVLGAFVGDDERRRKNWFLLFLVIIGTMPTAFAGLFLEKWVEKFFVSDSFLIVGLFF